MPQFGLIREATRAFNVPCIEQEGFEADDLIATYARQAREAGADGHHRLVRQGPDAARRRRVAMLDTMKDKAHRRGRGHGEVRRAAGQGRSRCRRWPAIRVDNVPGVPGIGVKTAARS